MLFPSDRGQLTVVVTGSECTGKSTLARELAARFDAPWSHEFVREYADRKGSALEACDVEPIARGQIRVEEETARQATRLVVKDTDLISTVTYARHYYGSCPEWVVAAARERRGDLYLLLAPDVPWVGDGQRDREEARDHMHALFRETLEEFGAHVAEVRGSWRERFLLAERAITDLLEQGGPPVALM